MKLWKYSGTLLTATGIIHTIYALFLGKEAFTEMLNNGLIDSIGENHNLGFASTVHHNRLHSRTNIRFLAFLTASTYYYLFKHEKAVRSIIHSELKTECSA